MPPANDTCWQLYTACASRRELPSRTAWSFRCPAPPFPSPAPFCARQLPPQQQQPHAATWLQPAASHGALGPDGRRGRQVEQKADLLDLNMDDGLIEGVPAMTKFVNLLVSDPEVSRVPFMVDSSKFHIVEVRG